MGAGTETKTFSLLMAGPQPLEHCRPLEPLQHTGALLSPLCNEHLPETPEITAFLAHSLLFQPTALKRLIKLN